MTSSRSTRPSERRIMFRLSSRVIAATNRVDILDPALLRSGRLDRKIEFPHPNETVRRSGRWHICGNTLFLFEFRLVRVLCRFIVGKWTRTKMSTSKNWLVVPTISTVHNAKLFASKRYECHLKQAASIVLLCRCFFSQGMIALRRGAVEVQHEDFMDAILEVQAKKKMNLNYYAWSNQAFVSFLLIQSCLEMLFYFLLNLNTEQKRKACWVQHTHISFSLTRPSTKDVLSYFLDRLRSIVTFSLRSDRRCSRTRHPILEVCQRYSSFDLKWYFLYRMGRNTLDRIVWFDKILYSDQANERTGVRDISQSNSKADTNRQQS